MLDAPIALRPARPADAEAIAAIYAESVARGDVTLDPRPLPAQRFFDEIAGADPAVVVVVAEEGDQVVGWGRLKPWSDRPGYRVAAEISIYVRADRARRGLGRALTDQLRKRAPTAGYHHLVARIIAGNAPSERLFAAAGFEVVGTQREVGWTGTRFIDVVLLQCLVAQAA
ncbi:MAG: N-acetyltransferase [Myxococcales bacterium]|nr:N-acetyltransferase [Myxococcales bacterium]